MEEIWLGLETRVRTLMKEILEPTIRRALENKDSIDKIYKQQEIMSYRLDDLDMNMGKYTRKIATIDDMSKRIAEFEASLRLVDVRFNRDREEIKTEVTSFNSRLISFGEYLEVFDHTKDALKNDLTTLTYALQSVKSYSEERLQSEKEETREKLHVIESALLKNEVKLAQAEKSAKGLGKEIGEMNTLLHTTAHSTDDLVKKTKDLRKSYKFMKKNAFDNIEKLRAVSVKNMTEAQVSDRKILDIIGNELPIRNRLMISDILHAILTDQFQIHNLAQLELQKFNQINDSSLIPELRSSLSHSRSRAIEIMSRPLPDKSDLFSASDINSRMRQRRGRQRTVFVIKKDSTEFESPISVRRDSNKIHKFESHCKTNQPLEKIDEEFSPRRSSVKASSNSPSKKIESFVPEKSITAEVDRHLRKSEMMSLRDYDVIKDELKIARFNTLIKQGTDIEEEEADDESFNSSCSYPPPIDYHPIIEEVRKEIIDMIHELKRHHEKDRIVFMETVKEIREDMEKKHKFVLMSIEKVANDARQDLKESEMILKQGLSECTSAINMRKRDQSDFTTEIKALNQKAEGIEGQYGAINERMDNVNKILESLSETVRIINVLSKQDEIDRESIALMGYKEGKNPKTSKPVVTIEKQCLSCTGQSSIVLSAFKMACLAYSPSQVTYRDSTYTRKDLIDIQGQILSALKIDKNLQFSSILDELRGGRSKTASYIKIRPLSVPSSAFTLQTPRADFSLDNNEFPPLLKKHGSIAPA